MAAGSGVGGWIFDGYAKATIGGKSALIHRLTQEVFYGPIPKGLESHHICPYKHCVNPGHIMLVTRTEHLALHRHPVPSIYRNPTMSYRQKRALMSPAQIAAYNARANQLAKARRERDPERIRTLDRAKYQRRLQRDRAGFLATRRAQARERQNRRKGIEVPELVL